MLASATLSFLERLGSGLTELDRPVSADALTARTPIGSAFVRSLVGALASVLVSFSTAFAVLDRSWQPVASESVATIDDASRARRAGLRSMGKTMSE
jgi:hypothetical protein